MKIEIKNGLVKCPKTKKWVSAIKDCFICNHSKKVINEKSKIFLECDYEDSGSS